MEITTKTSVRHLLHMGFWKVLLMLVLFLMLAIMTALSPAVTANVKSRNSATFDVVADLNAYWKPVVESHAHTYTGPNIVSWSIISNGRPHGITTCGGDFFGPENAYYCPKTRQVLVDNGWLRSISQRIGPNAELFIWSHEWSHHIQTLLGITDRYNAGEMTKQQMEQQADCFAGVHSRSLYDRGLLSSGGSWEEWRIVRELGDDGSDHGTAGERAHWFMIGFVTRTIDKCNP